MRNRIKLVGMTIRATDRQTEPDRAGDVHAIDQRIVAEFLRVVSPLLVQHRVAMKAGGDPLVGRGIGEHVACELFDAELVERHVGV